MNTRRLLAAVGLSHVLTGSAKLQDLRDVVGESAEPRPIIAALKGPGRKLAASRAQGRKVSVPPAATGQ